MKLSAIINHVLNCIITMSLFENFSVLFQGGPKNIKRRLLRDILLILLLTSAAILIIALLQGFKNKQQISTELVTKANKQAVTHFQSFIEPLANTLVLLGKWGESGLLKLNSAEILASQYQALMEIHPHIHAISLADTDGNITRLSHHNSQWMLYQNHNSKTTSSKWVNGKSIDKQIVRAETFNLSEAPWFRGALTLNSDKQFFFTAPYSLESTGERGITASLRWMNKDHPERTCVSTISFTMKELMKFMEQLQITAKSKVVILQKGATLLSNLRNNSPAITNSEQLLTTVVTSFNSGSLDTNTVSSINVNGKAWRFGLIQLHENNNDVWVGVVIPEDEIFKDFSEQWLQFSVSIGAILLIAIAMAIILVLRYGHQLRDLPQQHISMHGIENEIGALINAGESTTLEFKSTMRTNLTTGKKGKEIETSWLKTVVAFMNSDGGILLIGVSDDGELLGTAADNFANEDKCRLHFKNMLNSHIGAEFTRFLHLKIVNIKGKTILVIECERVRRPVFLSLGKQEDFYIRSGPSSMRLSMSQMIQYLGER